MAVPQYRAQARRSIAKMARPPETRMMVFLRIIQAAERANGHRGVRPGSGKENGFGRSGHAIGGPWDCRGVRGRASDGRARAWRRRQDDGSTEQALIEAVVLGRSSRIGGILRIGRCPAADWDHDTADHDGRRMSVVRIRQAAPDPSQREDENEKCRYGLPHGPCPGIRREEQHCHPLRLSSEAPLVVAPDAKRV